VYDGHTFPFPNETYDGIISNEVLEHVFNPDEFLSEILRCLKKNGKLLLTVPFVWDEHEQPGDFARYTSFGIKYLLEKHGFKIIYFHKTANDITVIFQLINDYIYKSCIGKNRRFNRIFINSLSSVFNILGLILSLILPKNNDLYLDNVILAQKN
jgi:SAM-dependent methyltransferase